MGSPKIRTRLSYSGREVMDNFGVQAGVAHDIAGEVYGIAHGAMGRDNLPELGLENRRRRRHLKTQFFGGIDGQDRRAPGIGDIQQPPTRGFGVVGQGLGKIVQFFDGVGPVDFVFAKNGLVDRVAAGHGLGVRFCGQATLFGAAGLENDHRLGGPVQGVLE